MIKTIFFGVKGSSVSSKSDVHNMSYSSAIVLGVDIHNLGVFNNAAESSVGKCFQRIETLQNKLPDQWHNMEMLQNILTSLPWKTKQSL